MSDELVEEGGDVFAGEDDGDQRADGPPRAHHVDGGLLSGKVLAHLPEPGADGEEVHAEPVGKWRGRRKRGRCRWYDERLCVPS